jgi:hypothetical protein
MRAHEETRGETQHGRVILKTAAIPFDTENGAAIAKGSAICDQTMF